MKNIYKLILFVILLIPFSVLGLSSDYEDNVASIVNKETEEDKINMYLFEGQECPHCKQEKEWLNIIKSHYSDKINVYEFEVWHNADNAVLMQKVQDTLETDVKSVPYMIIGDKTYVGFSDTIKSDMEQQLSSLLGEEVNYNIKNIPILGSVDVSKASLPIISIILGFIDGFNPCAMWVLLFLITMI